MIGIDLLEISRFKRALARHGEKFLQRVFTEKELSYFQLRGPTSVVISELAARYAAKEAVSKVLGTGIKLLGSRAKIGVSWKEIEILTEPTGKPKVFLQGRAKEMAQNLGFGEIQISLTHTKRLAQAIALAEKIEAVGIIS